MFDPIQFHLAINQFPLFTLLIGIALLLFGNILKQRLLVKTGLTILFVAGLAGIPIYISGSNSELHLTSIDQLEKSFLEEHASYGELACQASLVLSLLSLVVLLMSHLSKKNLNTANYIVLICAVFVLILFGMAADKGMMIRHHEIRGHLIKTKSLLTFAAFYENEITKKEQG